MRDQNDSRMILLEKAERKVLETHKYFIAKDTANMDRDQELSTREQQIIAHEKTCDQQRRDIIYLK